MLYQSAFETEMAIEKIKRHKSPGIDQILTRLINQGAEQFAVRSIKLLILFGIRMNCLGCGRSRSLNLFTRRVIKQVVIIIEAYHFGQGMLAIIWCRIFCLPVRYPRI
jgi:hypothetical protein